MSNQPPDRAGAGGSVPPAPGPEPSPTAPRAAPSGPQREDRWDRRTRRDFLVPLTAAPRAAPSGPQREERWDRRTRRDFLVPRGPAPEEPKLPGGLPELRHVLGAERPAARRSGTLRVVLACVVALAILCAVTLCVRSAARSERRADTAPPDTFDAPASSVASAPDVGAQLGPSGAPASSAPGAARVRAPRAPHPSKHGPYYGRDLVNPWE
jgi:hypothetical protein